MTTRFLGIAAALTFFGAVSPAPGQSVATFDSRWYRHPPQVTILTVRPATGDIVDWGQIGTPNLTITSPQRFTSTGGTTGTVNLNGTGLLVSQCCIGITGTFDGDFAPGDKVLVNAPGNPLTIKFNTPVQTVGAQIQDNRIGDYFTAEIEAFHGRKLLGTFTENGFSGDVGDNSNIFLGVQDKHADITSVVYLTYTSSPAFMAQSVAINQMTIAPGSQHSVSPH